MNKIKCYDNNGKTFDRYTVVYLNNKCLRTGLYEARAMSSNPFHPQGFGQYTTVSLGKHLGKVISFDDLPNDCKKLVKRDLE